MAMTEATQLAEYCEEVARRAHQASRSLAGLSGAVKNRWLRESASRLREQAARIMAANAEDLGRADEFGLSAAQVDRLRLTPERIESIAAGLEDVAMLADPIGEVIESSRRPNGLEVSKVRVPLGVVFFVYESRPNVTADAAAICVKSGNAVILRGGKEAAASSRALVEILLEVGREVGLPEGAVQLVGIPDREAVGHFLGLPQWIDVAIPRGGPGLIEAVVSQAKMPVIKHFAGNCHVYVDASADEAMAERIVVNAKCQRPGVCNACETLLVHSAIASTFLPRVGQALRAQGVELRACEQSRAWLPDAIPATEVDYETEFLDLILAVRTVDDLDQAIAHIERYSSGHTEAIVTCELAAARRFTQRVDSSAVLVNASTRFNDGSQFGLGAEIGISTDKFHARGPCGLRELTSYKYIAYGDGLIRES